MLGLTGLRGIQGFGGARYSPSGGLSYGKTFNPMRQFNSPKAGMNSLGGLGQASRYLKMGNLGANLTGNSGLAGNLGLAGGALSVMNNLQRGEFTPQDVLAIAKMGAQTGAFGGGAAAGESTAAGSGSGAGAAGIGGAGLGLGLVGLGAYFGDKATARQAKAQMEGANRTVERLNDLGVNWSDLTPDKFMKVATPYATSGSLGDVYDKYRQYQQNVGRRESPDTQSFQDWAKVVYAPKAEINTAYLQDFLSRNPNVAQNVGMHDLVTDFPLVYAGALERLTQPYQAGFNQWMENVSPYINQQESRQEQSGG